MTIQRMSDDLWGCFESGLREDAGKQGGIAHDTFARLMAECRRARDAELAKDAEIAALRVDLERNIAQRLEHQRNLTQARDEGRTLGIKAAMDVCKEEGHPELMPCLTDLLDGPEEE